MRVIQIFGIGALAIALALVVAQSWLTPAGKTTTFPLQAPKDSSASGTVAITSGLGAQDPATLSLDVAGLAPGQTYPVQLHAGTCAEPSASAGFLGNVTGDATGRATLTTTTARASAAGAAVTLTPALLADGDHVVEIQGTQVVACASVPASVSSTSTEASIGAAFLPLATGLGILGVVALVGSIVFARSPTAPNSAA
jgi:hypothetical protein